MNRIHQSATIGMFLIILSGIYLGCGDEDNPGTLEIHLKNLDTVSGQNLTVVVRANGDERAHSELGEVISVALEPGVANPEVVEDGIPVVKNESLVVVRIEEGKICPSSDECELEESENP
jgi:hypothetical protein